MAKDTLLLFDVDGVLLSPKGYKEALRATVDYFARQMGQSPIDLTYDEIAFFEACGTTNEWVSGAMCVAAILVEALASHPDLVRATFKETLRAIRDQGLRSNRPDFTALSRELFERNPDGVHTTKPILAYFNEQSDPKLHAVLAEILEDVRPPHAPVSKIFQHYTLGHTRFADTFGMPPEFETDSFLITLDSPAICADNVRRLQRLTATGNYGMSLFTARPSLPPVDLTLEELLSTDKSRYPPEGDLVKDLLGIDEGVPLIAGGRMTWLADQRGKTPDAYIKPSPVQALAAIGAALSGQEKSALEAAAALAEDKRLQEPLARLRDEQTRIVVFEDAIGGIQATGQAITMLRSANVEIDFEAVGIAPEPAKQTSLKKVAHRVVNDIDSALNLYLT